MVRYLATIGSVLAILPIAACSRPSQDDSQVSDIAVTTVSYDTIPAKPIPVPPVRADTLALITTYGDTATFGMVQAIFETPHHLLIADRYSSPHIAVLDRALDSVSYWIGEHGSDLREFADPTTFDRVASSDNRVWVHDFENRRLSLLEVDGEGTASILEEIPLLVSRDIENTSWIGDSIVATALENHATFVFFDSTGKPVSRIALEEPFSEGQVTHGTGRLMLNRASMAVHPQDHGIALGYYSSSRIVVLDRRGFPKFVFRGPYDATARYRVANDRFYWADGNQFAYTRLMTSSKHIIAFYCGCTYHYANSETRTMSRDVDPALHVFTWNGEFVGEYRFGVDVLASSLAISRDGKSIYGAVKSQIFQWHLPPLVHFDAL